MRLGLFLILPQPPEVSQAVVFAAALADAVRAEELGFDTVWLAEHHSSSYGLAGAPSVVAGAIAAATERIAIGYAVNVTPLHNPVRLAEEIATVDQLSGGRVIAGFGPGYAPVEFAALGSRFDDRHQRHSGAVAAIIDHWQHSGGVRPQQIPHPPVAVTASTPAAAQWAAASGFDLLTLGADQQVAALAEAYRRTAPATPDAPRRGRCALLRSICVLPDGAGHAPVGEQVQVQMQGQVRAATRWTLGHRNRMVGQPPPAAAEVDDYLRQRVLLRDAADLPDDLCRLAALGVDEVICWCRWGSLGDDTVRRTMTALGSARRPAAAQDGESWT